jgi:predicted DsbA family dithiol-disulfide isomerase
MSDQETLYFYYDYVDPVSYILKGHLQNMVETGGFVLESHPLELVLPTQPILDPEEEEYRTRWEGIEGEVERLGLSFQRPWIVPWTRKAHELAFHAREQDSFEEIHEALFRAYLIESRDIGRIDVLVEIARSAGMDPVETKAVLDVDRYRDEVEQTRPDGLSTGPSVPPILMMKDMIFDGDPTREALKRYLASCKDIDTT